MNALPMLLFMLLFSCWNSLFAQLANTNSVEFRAVEVFLNATNAPLAAYQLEFKAVGGDVKIVGIEGGEHPAFAGPSFYDPQAMQQERVILAAFSTNSVTQLPTGRTRVATIHLQVRHGSKLKFETKLEAAADSNGNKITAGVAVEEKRAQ
ncbi:MAG: hypothetical protein HOP33_15010 [Verrucomicrobia bacterium]|nr:hypothetical protein [Verrucomicrobiota bacterium]